MSRRLFCLVQTKLTQDQDNYALNLLDGEIVFIFPSCSLPADCVVEALKAASVMFNRPMGLKGILIYLIVPHNWIHLAEPVCYWIMFHIGWMASNCEITAFNGDTFSRTEKTEACRRKR